MKMTSTVANSTQQLLKWISVTPHHAMSRIETPGFITLMGYSDILNIPIKLWNSSLHLFTNTPKNEPQIFIPNEEGRKLLEE